MKNIIQEIERLKNIVCKLVKEGSGGTSLPVSATQPGIVDNTPLQELGGVDKLIHGVTIGTGSSTGANNAAFGIASQSAIGATGGYNSSFGYNSLKSNTTGEENTSVGANALSDNTIGTYNTAVGYGALRRNISGQQNVAIGAFALTLTTNFTNVAVGASSMSANTTGSGTALGYRSLNAQTIGADNIGIGSQAGSGITTGNGNTILAGATSTGGISTGNNNLIVAQNLGNTTGVTTGSGNTIIGKVTGLAAALTNTIIISDGVGTQRFISDSTNVSRLPAQTIALITADATGKAILTKEYIPTALATGVATNATTTALTLANLNAAYPTATLGFRVHALSISGGGLIYQKTAAGWCSQTATVVV